MTRNALFATVALFLGSQMAFAQNVGSSPQGGIFGGGSTAGARQRLDFTFALSEALDSDVPVDLRSRTPQGGLQTGGYSTMLIGTADYTRTRRRAEVAGTAFSSFRYYERRDVVTAVSHSGALGATVKMPSNASVEMNQTAAYSPSYLYGLFPTAALPELGEAIPAAPDYREDKTRSYSYSSQLTLAVGSARETRASVTAQYQRTNFFQSESPDPSPSPPRPQFETYGGRARLSHGFGRNSTLSAEYEYRTGEFGFGGISIEHRLRIGTDYSHAFSARRRATFRLNVAPGTLVIPASPLNTGLTGTLYKLGGDASAEYRFLRSWSLNGSFRRGVEYIAVFQTPVFRDAASLELGGLVSRRLDVSASAGYAVGESALTRRSTSQNFDTYTGTVQARYALARPFALYFQYLYYYYDLRGQAALLAPDLPSVLELHGVRAGLMIWVPALRRR